MLRDSLIALLSRRLGNRTGMDAWIVTEIQAAQVELEHSPELPWFLVKESTGLATAAGVRTVTAPADFLRVYDAGGLWLTNEDNEIVEVVRKPYRLLRGSRALDESGDPEFYDVLGTSLYLFPRPSAVRTLSLHYYGAAAVLTTNTENTWLLHASDLIAAEVGLKMARFLRDSNFISIFAADQRIAAARLIAENTAFEEAGKDAELGG